MISNEEMENLWWKYRNEGVAKNLSMQAFCSMRNVPYNAFEKYLKLRRHFSDVHHITITDVPQAASSDADSASTIPSESTMTSDSGKKEVDKADAARHDGKNVRIMISVRMTNGIQISKKNMDYPELRSLVEKLEALC